ncbi:MAG TPA: MFS transporter [Gemmatimonadaceae bacterium]|nr:MFS transporter [Gemmatimonadaceae bacterium]
MRGAPPLPTPSTDRSYRALLAFPSVGRILLSMQIARIGQSMMAVAIVLFALNAYHSPGLAGLATFFSIMPGLLASPVAGALLDRHGRTRLVVLDYLVAMSVLVIMGILAHAHLLPAWLMMALAGIASLTAPLSSTGLRSLFPILVPPALWERANAIDSTGYVFATIVGPPIAATLVALSGGPAAMGAIGVTFGVAAVVVMRTPDPGTPGGRGRPLLRDAWDGLVYTWRNATLRGLGWTLSVANLLNGTLNIAVPLLVLRRFQLDMRMVGLVFAVQGVAGLISAILFGRHDSRDRERMMLGIPMIGAGVIAALLLVDARFASLLLVMAIIGALGGPLDIALFTLRQRRTEPAWTGRAFAVSMSFNYLGIPVGAALAGRLAAQSIETALAFGAAASVAAGVLVFAMVPAGGPATAEDAVEAVP